MSCLVMNPEPLAALANAVETRVNCDYSYWGFEAPDSLYRELKDCQSLYLYSAKKIYRRLYEINVRAYNGRYKDHEEPEDETAPDIDIGKYAIDHRPTYREHGFAVQPWHYHLAKLLDFWLYQTNEDATRNDPLRLAIQEFRDSLYSFIVQNSPDYTVERWGELPPVAQTVKAGDNRTYTITEVCPHCESEIEMHWDTDTQGFKAFCPVCGKRLMLCDECLHAEDNSGGRCDFDSEKDGCWRNPPENPPLDSTGESEFDYILAYIREGSFAEFEFLTNYIAESCFDEEICRDRLRMLWTAFCLHHDLDADTHTYDYYLSDLWKRLQKTEEGTSEWSDLEGFKMFMCKYLV